MAISERPNHRFSSDRIPAWRAKPVSQRFTWGLLLTIGLVCGACGPPQMGISKETFKAVDALYTAVGLRDIKQLDRCEAALKALHKESKLPDEAAETLAAIVEKARAGSWEPAQEELSWFMEGQRR